MSIVLDFYVAGLQYHQEVDDLEGIEEDDIVYLVPEPDNEYDSNAVRVEDQDFGMLGYVPKKVNQQVKELMETRAIKAKVFRCNPEKEPWKVLQIALHDQDKGGDDAA